MSIKQILADMSENKRKQFRKKALEGWTNTDLAEVFNVTESQVFSIKFMMRISSKGQKPSRGKKPQADIGPQQRTRICMAHGCDTEFISEHFGVRMCPQHRKGEVDPQMRYM